MTRRDYVLIAAALKAAQDDEVKAGHPVYDTATYKLADVLARENPRFDRERFLKACGVQS
jgi:hypothetical protein